MTIRQDYPLMMYHIHLGQKVVKDNQEAELYEGQGWIRNYQVFQKKNTIIEKIKYHTEALEKLKKENENYIVNQSQSATMTQAIKPVIEKQQEAKPRKKGRGRPKKEV